MMSRRPGKSIRRNLRQKGSTLVVYWDITTGTPNAGTQELQGGSSAILSGTMKCFALEEPAKSVVRQFAEIKAGDLIADVDPDGIITVIPNQQISGTITLDSIVEQGVRFGWQGRIYAQKDVGSRLAVIWDAVFADEQMHRTLLLKLDT